MTVVGTMTVAECQREVRTVYMGGFVGGLVSGTLWLVSAALATWSSFGAGIMALVFGGPLIYPGMVLVMRLMGRSTHLSPGNSFDQLATQIAITIPLALPVAFGATAHHAGWFYPSCMVIVGAHYMPFVFLYGMWQKAVLGAVLIVAGVLLGLYARHTPIVGAWFTAAVLILYGLIARAITAREAPPAAA